MSVFGRLKYAIEQVAVGNVSGIFDYKRGKNNERNGRKLEKEIARELRMALPHVYTNVYIPWRNNRGFTEIDVLVVTANGIFVIEAKNYKGAITGEVYSTNWRATYRNGKSYSLRSPVVQNEGHIKRIEKYLNMDSICHSVVVFPQEAEVQLGTVKNRGHMLEQLTNAGRGAYITNLPNVVKAVFSIPDGGVRLSKKQLKEINKKMKRCSRSNYFTKLKHLRTVAKAKKYNK